MRLCTTLIQPASDTPSSAMRAALAAITTGAMRSRRTARHHAIREFLANPERLDAIIPGLSELDPGPSNDLLREFRLDAFRQMQVHPRTLHAALVSARLLCWLRLHKPDALALLMRFCANRHIAVGEG